MNSLSFPLVPSHQNRVETMGTDLQLILESKNLSKSEQIAIEHFKKKPDGRGFFSVAEIMAKHQQWEEAIQFLSRGLERHPSYSVARVFLGHLFFKRQHFHEAWATLETSPIPLKGNLTAQILKLKLAILLGMPAEAGELIKELKQQDFQESEVKVIIDQMDVKPFEQVRSDFADFLKVPIHILPHEKSSERESEPVPLPPSESFLTVASRDKEQAESSFRTRVAKGFFASPIHSLFSRPVTRPAPDESELDELTRARLMRRQGMYQKASEIYQRLVHEVPENELLRREYAEIRDLRDTQKEIDQRSSPELVESMEKVRMIDFKLRLLNDLLSSLDKGQYEY